MGQRGLAIGGKVRGKASILQRKPYDLKNMGVVIYD